MKIPSIIIKEKIGNLNKKGYYEIRECINCNKDFKVEGYRIREKAHFIRGKFCCEKCHKQWMLLNGNNFNRKSTEFRKKSNFICVCCNEQKRSYCIVTHHIIKDIDKEYNWLPLCRRCHATIEAIKRGNKNFYDKIMDYLKKQQEGLK